MQSRLQKFAYLADIFSHFTVLKAKMQNKEKTPDTSSDKLHSFNSKLTLWRSFVEQGRLDMFPLCSEHSTSSTHSDLISQHRKILNKRFNHYFPAQSLAQFDWIHDPWSSCALESSKDLPLLAQKQLAQTGKSTH